MNDVKNIEAFFHHEFSSEELMQAIEKMNYYSDEVVKLYDLQNEESPEKTYILGKLAASAIESKIEENYNGNWNENLSDEIAKIGMDIAKDKYSSYKEVKPFVEKLTKDNIRPYSKDMRNLERVLEDWESLYIETKDGNRVYGEYDFIWHDNWKLISEYSNRNSQEYWKLNYKSVPVVFVQDGKAKIVKENISESFKSKINLGDVLHLINQHTGAICPELEETPLDDFINENIPPKQRMDYIIFKFDQDNFIGNPKSFEQANSLEVSMAIGKGFTQGDYFNKGYVIINEKTKELEQKGGNINDQNMIGIKLYCEPKYKPTDNYYTDQMNYKQATFARTMTTEQMVKIGDAQIKIGEYLAPEDKVKMILPISRHPDDKNLYTVLAQNNKNHTYTVWTSYNAETNSLNNGHYDIKDLNEAARLMCQFSNEKPLHIEHTQQYRHDKNNEIGR